MSDIVTVTIRAERGFQRWRASLQEPKVSEKEKRAARKYMNETSEALGFCLLNNSSLDAIRPTRETFRAKARKGKRAR